MFDLEILFATIPVVLFGRGAYDGGYDKKTKIHPERLV
jgi:hypothetical protein